MMKSGSSQFPNRAELRLAKPYDRTFEQRFIRPDTENKTKILVGPSGTMRREPVELKCDNVLV
jgi:hypothetical protein